MNNNLSYNELIERAKKEYSAACLLLENDYLGGSVNRAYYAMFYAARAALLIAGAPVNLEEIRTHQGLVGAFGNHIVNKKLVSVEIGRYLKRTLKARMISDYAEYHTTSDNAKIIVEQAGKFITAIQAKFENK